MYSVSVYRHTGEEVSTAACKYISVYMDTITMVHGHLSPQAWWSLHTLVHTFWFITSTSVPVGIEIIEGFLFLCRSPPGNNGDDPDFVPACSVSSSSTLQIFWNASHSWWWLHFPPVFSPVTSLVSDSVFFFFFFSFSDHSQLVDYSVSSGGNAKYNDNVLKKRFFGETL